MTGCDTPTGAPRRIAVFRPQALDGLLCATPALRALRHAHPDAQITLVGLPWARGLAHRLASIDDFVPFPGWPGLTECAAADAPTLPRVLAAQRARRYDLAVQLHDGGSLANRLVAAFGARRSVGFAPVAAADVDRLPWPRRGSEAERLLALTDHLGLPRRGLQIDFPLRDIDREAADRLCAPLRGQRFAIVHPGPLSAGSAERFAAAADALACAGLAIVLTGSAAEAGLTRAVAAAMRAPALDLAGCTSLWTLGALVEWSAQVVCNDSGVAHIAAALGTRCTPITGGPAGVDAGAARAPALADLHPVRPGRPEQGVALA